MKLLVLPCCLLILLGVASCSALKFFGKSDSDGSRVLKEFNPSWLFAGECITQRIPGAKVCMRSYTGVVKDATGKLSAEKLASSISTIASTKIVELGANVCGTVTPSVTQNSRTVIITYQAEAMIGTMTIAMQVNQAATAATWILVIDEEVRPAKAPGGG